MMLPILIFLFAFPDIKQVSIENEFTKDFTVTESIDDSTTDCSENPSSGGELAVPSQIELPFEYESPLPLDAGVNERNNMKRITGGEAYRDETPVRFPKPDPEPDPLLEPPQVVTPEPPTALILFTAAIMLLLLFGLRQKKLTR